MFDWKTKNIFKLIDRNDLEGIKELLEEKPELLEKRGGSWCWQSTPLLWATYKNKPDIVKFLIEKGADLEKRTVSDSSLSPLIWALDCKHIECAEILAEAGADFLTSSGSSKRGIDYIRANSSLKYILTKYAPELLEEEQSQTQSYNKHVIYGEFQKSGEHLVSITEYDEWTGLGLTSLYNFKAATITYKCNDQSPPNVMAFSKAASQEELESAAQFLVKNDGNAYGWDKKLIR